MVVVVVVVLGHQTEILDVVVAQRNQVRHLRVVAVRLQAADRHLLPWAIVESKKEKKKRKEKRDRRWPDEVESGRAVVPEAARTATAKRRRGS